MVCGSEMENFHKLSGKFISKNFLFYLLNYLNSFYFCLGFMIGMNLSFWCLFDGKRA